MGQIRPWCSVSDHGSLSPNSIRARRVLMTAESGLFGHSRPLSYDGADDIGSSQLGRSDEISARGARILAPHFNSPHAQNLGNPAQTLRADSKALLAGVPSRCPNR